MDSSDIEAWVDRYVRAWGSNNPIEIGDLFTDDARYFTAPDRPPWEGRRNIVDGWLKRKDEPGEWGFRSEVLGVSGDLGFVRGWTTYHTEESDYSNLWMIRLTADGRCSEFVEWWMEVEK